LNYAILYLVDKNSLEKAGILAIRYERLTLARQMKTIQDYLDGEMILVDKPYRWTSFDVVNQLRWALRKVSGVKKSR
jgi:hypothetical protein